ncbi:hypothetical protein GIB67_040498 [Kingdonia uniflora]|uniref:Uncharacterized protein n=1 Tax=Kingdonia uniflora TaxID=39325 RepID=A0A7J7L5B3_9MAGN|nr:hypothetical protein GIB67_040498 [Kingdonia uniflora]
MYPKVENSLDIIEAEGDAHTLESGLSRDLEGSLQFTLEVKSEHDERCVWPCISMEHKVENTSDMSETKGGEHVLERDLSRDMGCPSQSPLEIIPIKTENDDERFVWPCISLDLKVENTLDTSETKGVEHALEGNLSRDMGCPSQSPLEIIPIKIENDDERFVWPCISLNLKVENTVDTSETKGDEHALEGNLSRYMGCPSQSPLDIIPIKTENDEERFVWPWIGIVVNLPIEFKGGKYVGESGSNLREQLTKQGFNPWRVTPLWNYRGHSGKAIVEFTRDWPDWPAFHNAISFEKYFKAEHFGRSEWYSKEHYGSQLYGWVAREDDYEANDIVGEHLRKIGDLKTLNDIEDEDARKTSKLVSNLSSVIEVKKSNYEEMERKVEEKSDSLRKVIETKEKLTNTYNEELKKMHSNTQINLQKIFCTHEKLRLDLESQRKELELHGKELERRKAQSEGERMKLIGEREQNAAKNDAIDMATIEEKEAAKSFLRLIEQHKREKEEHHKRIIQLEKERDAKQALELEVQQLKGILQVRKYMVCGDDLGAQEKMNKMSEELAEKEEELEYMINMSNDLMVKQYMSNIELQEARKTLIGGFKEKDLSTAVIGLKRMGELDVKPFKAACMRKYSDEEVEVNAIQFCSLWDSYLRNPEWHPFKMIKVNGNDERIINDDDEKLKELRNELGNEAVNAVKIALTEIAEYNPSGGYIVEELWNFKERRKATLKEGATVVLNKWKKQKR